MTVDLVATWVDRAGLLEHHEAGHAVVAHCLGRRPRGVRVSMVHDAGEVDVTGDDPLTHAMVALAGERAELLCPSWYPELGHPTSGFDRSLVARLGVKRTPELVRQVDLILLDNARRLHGLAAILERRYELGAEELREVLA